MCVYMCESVQTNCNLYHFVIASLCIADKAAVYFLISKQQFPKMNKDLNSVDCSLHILFASSKIMLMPLREGLRLQLCALLSRSLSRARALLFERVLINTKFKT